MPNRIIYTRHPMSGTLRRRTGEALPAHPGDADGKFSLAIYPDTQTEVQHHGLFVKQQFIDRSDWVVANREALDIRGVLHVGDVINWDTAPYREVWDPNDDHRQFEGAVRGLQPLRNAGIPTSLNIGNHDTMATGPTGGSARTGYETIPPGITLKMLNRMTDGFNYYLRHSEDIPTWQPFEPNKVDNGYWTFDAAGAKWLVVNLELWPRVAVTNWAKDVISSNTDRNVVIHTHNMFTGSGSGINIDSGGQVSTSWQYGDSSPQRIWNELVEPYANVKFVACGHTGTQGARVFTTGNGSRVVGLLGNNVSGEYNPVRILEIDVSNNTASTWNYATNGNQTNDMTNLTNLNFITS